MNDPAIEITQLSFIQHSSCVNLLDSGQECAAEAPQLIQRGLKIQMAGQLLNKPDTNTAITRWVRIRNDQLREGNGW